MTNVRNGTISQSFIIIMVNSMIVRLPVSLIIKSPIAQDNENSKLQFVFDNNDDSINHQFFIIIIRIIIMIFIIIEMHLLGKY